MVNKHIICRETKQKSIAGAGLQRFTKVFSSQIAFLVAQLVNSLPPWVHRSFFSVCEISLFLSLIRTLVVALRAHLDNSEYSPILSSLTLSHLQRPSFQITFINSRHLFRLHCQSKVKVLITQSCPTFCSPMDSSPPGSSVHGILQTRILECTAIAFFPLTAPNSDVCN